MEEVRSPNLVLEKQTINKRKADFRPHRPPPPPSSNSYGAPAAPSYHAPAPAPSYSPPAPSYSSPAPAPSYGAPTTPAPPSYDNGEIDLHKKENKLVCFDLAV